MATDTTSTSPACASDSNANAPASATAPREHFASRLGFILISAGCAIGLGNVWRFPDIAGEYGGAAFIVLYLIFLVILGLPVMVMEFAVGRASQRSAAQAFDILQPSRRWHWFSWWAYIGCMLLMMFYTTVCGWMLAYMAKMATGTFVGLDPDGVAGVFGTMLANPSEMVGWMLAVVVIGFFVCSLGLQKGVERITKVMMIALLGVMALLVVRAVTLPGADAGLEFYLVPDFGKMFAGGLAGFGDAVYAAMGQAFFTLSAPSRCPAPTRAWSSTWYPTSARCSPAAWPVSGTRCMRPWARRSSRCRWASRPWRSSAVASASRTRSRARPCASAVWTPLWPFWRASSSSPPASLSPSPPTRAPRSCSSRCPTCSTRCLWGSCGARCFSCS